MPIVKGFLYLPAVPDWHSRFVLSWQLSNTLDVGFCQHGPSRCPAPGPGCVSLQLRQCSQFTNLAYEQALLAAGGRISRDGRGRATNNAFIERLWRMVKWEHISLNLAEDGHQPHPRLHTYFE